MRTRRRPRALTASASVAAIALFALLGGGGLAELEPADRADAEATDTGGSHPQTAVPPARVDAHASPDPTWSQAVVGSTLYGIGFTGSTDVGHLERWTDSGWARDAAVTTTALSQAVSYDDALYYLAYESNASVAGTALWRYDGHDGPTRIATFGRFTTLTVAATGVYVSEPASGGATNIYRYDGSTAAPTLLLQTTLDVSAIAGLGDRMFLWSVDDENQSQVYRIDGGSLTLIGPSAFMQGGVEWNGAIWFGGGEYTSTDLHIGVYEFDGTTTTEAPVDKAVDFSGDGSYPTLGVYDGDLAIIDDAAETSLTLTTWDGTTATRVGPVADPDASPQSIVEYDGKLFASLLDSPESTWVYDADAVAGAPVASSAPAIAGTAGLGTTLTAVPGGWTPTATLAYRWRANGTPIAGATGSTFTPTTREVGKTIDVEITGAQPGLTSTTRVSAATAAVKPGRIALRSSVSGTMRAGATLKAAPIGLSPKAAKLAYRWYRSGRPIPAATKSVYRVTSADVGRRISVRITATASGYAAASALSASRTALKR